MEVTFSVNLDFNKKGKDEKKRCNCIKERNSIVQEESSIDKWLDLAQKFVKAINVK